MSSEVLIVLGIVILLMGTAARRRRSDRGAGEEAEEGSEHEPPPDGRRYVSVHEAKPAELAATLRRLAAWCEERGSALVIPGRRRKLARLLHELEWWEGHMREQAARQSSERASRADAPEAADDGEVETETEAETHAPGDAASAA